MIDQPTESAYVCIMIAAQVGLAKVAPASNVVSPLLHHCGVGKKKLINLKQSHKIKNCQPQKHKHKHNHNNNNNKYTIYYHQLI